MDGHAVHRRRHAVLADAVMEIAAGEIAGSHRLLALGPGVVGAGEIGRAADQLRQRRDQRVEHHARGLPRRRLRRLGGEFGADAGHRRIEARRQRAAARPLELAADRRRGGAQPLLPGRRGRGAAPAHGAPPFGDVAGNDERRLAPAEALARAGDLGGSQRRAMGSGGAGLGRGAEGDHRAAGDERGQLRLARPRQRRRHRLGVMAVDGDAVPAGGGEALQLILGGGKLGAAVDRDGVVVPQHDQLVEPQMPGERDRLLADALHQAAVAGDDIGVVIDEIIAEAGVEQPLGERHADGVGEPLAERAGGGLDPRRMAIFGMAGGAAAELAEALELVEAHAGISRQMQQRIEQHRAMPGREHEAVAIGPVRPRRIEFEEAAPQHRGDIGHAHGHAGMAARRLLHRIHGEHPDDVGHAPQHRVARGRQGRGWRGRGGLG